MKNYIAIMNNGDHFMIKHTTFNLLGPYPHWMEVNPLNPDTVERNKFLSGTK